jgi:hypothetical protein
VAEDFHHLLNLALATDGRRNLIHPRQPVHRSAEVFQVRRQFKLLAILFFVLLAHANARADVFHERFGIRAERAEHAAEDAAVLRESHEEVCGFDGLAPLRTRTLHRALEEIYRLRRDAQAFADVLETVVVQPPLDLHFDMKRVEREVAHGRVEKFGLLRDESMENVFDGNVILVTTLRLLHRVLKNPLPALRETIFICSEINHCIPSILVVASRGGREFVDRQLPPE